MTTALMTCAATEAHRGALVEQFRALNGVCQTHEGFTFVPL